jgi:N4-gp56 family major capsid protein
MAAMNWTFDASTGVYKNHFISNQLLYWSALKLKCVPFTKPAPGAGRKKGETFNIMHVTELPDPTTNAQLEESTRIPIDKLQYGNRAITMVEWGRGVEYTNLSEQLGKFDPQSILQKTLTRQMDRIMDAAAARAFMSTDTKITFTPTSASGGTFDTDGTPSTNALSPITFDHMGVLCDYLNGDIHCPPYEGDDFVMLTSRKNTRGLKIDPLWQQVHMYLQKGDLFFRSEVGKAEQIRVVQVDREQCFANSIGSNALISEGAVFGDEAVYRVEAEPPALYADPNYQSDFGRVKAIAWRGILAYASVWDTANDREAKIIKISSSAS